MTTPAQASTNVAENADARTRLLALVNASWMTQAAAVAVQLRLPDLLADEPRSVAALARETQCHEPSLSRLLQALTSLDLLTQSAEGAFALTASGALLRSDVTGSLASWAVFCGTRSWTTWSRLIESVRTGQSVRKQTRGVDGFAHLEEDPEAALLFNRAMVDLTQPIASAIAQAVDFTGVDHIVDVGGGVGALLITILLAHPRMRGVLFDLSHATRLAGERCAAAGVAERCEFATGSFFERVPNGADAYLLKSVLHDWDDAHSAQILRNCRVAMAANARLLVIERMAPEHYSSSPHDQGIARSDLNMLVGTGGRERTEAGYRAMVESVGFRMKGLIALPDGYSVMEAVSA